jgi:hypothetical protein
MIEFDESDMAKTYRGRARHARAAAHDTSSGDLGDLKIVLERLADQYEAKAAAYERAKHAVRRISAA